jgi:hypothetical protein
MNADEFIKQYMTTEASLDYVWSKAQAIASEYGINLSSSSEEDPKSLNIANAQFIAGEIDKENAGLVVAESSGQLAITEGTKNKKNKENTPAATTNNQGIENLRVAVQNLKTTVASESDAMYEMSNRKSCQVEDAAAARIVNRYKQISPNIVSKVSAGLQEYADESASFRGQIGSIFDEAFADIVNN